MIFHTYQAPANLTDYIRCFWTLESTESSPLPFIHRATAECCPELIFYFRGDVNVLQNEWTKEKTFRSGLYAQSRNYRKFSIEKGFGMLGVYLYPQTIPLLFNIPASSISDCNLDIKSLFNKEGEALEDRVMCAASHQLRIKLISDFLMQKLTEPDKKYKYLSGIIRHAVMTGAMETVNNMANACNLSVRQIERDFKSLSGFNPRLFSKLTRFRSLMESIPTKEYSMVDLAYEFNYYDQSHFINEFKRFTGLSPSQYMRDRLSVDNERMTPETNNDH
jgi:AraC-like DNA-binding protein